MKLRMFCAVAAAAASFGGVSTTHADSNWIGVNALLGAQTPGWFIAPGAEPGFLNLPRWNSTNSFHFPIAIGAPAISVFAPELRLKGGEYGATIGYTFNDGTMPPWMGQRVRIGLTGTYISFADTNSASGIPGPSAFGIMDLQGRAVFAVNSAGTGVSESLRVTRHGFDLNLRIASDFPLAPGWTLTPSVALFGGRTVDTYNFDSAFTVGSTPVIFNQIDEKVRTWSLGGDFAAGLTWQATGALSFNLSGRGGIVWQRSHLEGTQCAVLAAISCTTAPFAPFFAGFLSNSTASDSRSRIGFRGGAALSGSLDMRFGILTIGGFFLYDSAVPGIENPSQTVLLGPGTSTGQTARIRFDDGFRYGAIATLRIPLLLQ